MEAQRFDVAPVIGTEFFNAILDQDEYLPGDAEHNPDYDELIERLKDAVVYYTESRLTETIQANMTTYGYEIKDGEFGNPISDGYRMSLVRNAQAKGAAVLSEVTKWLNSDDSPDFVDPGGDPLWDKTSCTKKQGPNAGIRISAIGKTHGDAQ